MLGWAGLILLGGFVTSSLAGGWSDEDDEMDCQGDVCFEKYQYLKTAKNNVAGGLKYQEKLSARAESRDLVSVCLPAVNEKFVAFMFNSCSEKKGAGAEVCLVQKRGWLKSNGKHLVPNKEDLLSNLAALPGGDEAVRTCLELAPEYQYEQYEIYDYADYGAEWDYLEVRRQESGARAVRKRRAAKDAGENNNKPKKGNGKNNKKTKRTKKGGRKGTQKGSGKGGNGKKSTQSKKPKDKKKGKGSKGNKGRKKGDPKKGDNKKTKKEKKGKKKGGKVGKSYGRKKGDKKKEKKDRKAEKAADRKAAKDEKADKAEKPEKQSGVSKATMSQLSCVEERIAELLTACGEKLLGSREV